MRRGAAYKPRSWTLRRVYQVYTRRVALGRDPDGVVFQTMLGYQARADYNERRYTHTRPRRGRSYVSSG